MTTYTITQPRPFAPHKSSFTVRLGTPATLTEDQIEAYSEKIVAEMHYHVRGYRVNRLTDSVVLEIDL